MSHLVTVTVNLTAQHQTGLNSGVMHMGLYYKPGSLKARLCVEGGEMMYSYLEEKRLPYNKCGKVIVAVDEKEVPSLKKIYETARINKCKDIRLISAEELRKIEPHCKVSRIFWTTYMYSGFPYLGPATFLDFVLCAHAGSDGYSLTQYGRC